MGCSLSWECTSRFPTNVYGRQAAVVLSCRFVPGVLETNDSIEPVPKWGFQICSVAKGTLITVDGCEIRSTTNFGWLNPYKWDIYQPKGSEKLNEFQWLFRSIRFIANSSQYFICRAVPVIAGELLAWYDPEKNHMFACQSQPRFDWNILK